MSSTLDICHMNFCVTLVKACNQSLGISTISLWHYNNRCWPLEWLLWITCASRSLFISFYAVIVLHGNGVWLLWDRFWVACVNLHVWDEFVPILVSSCANCNLMSPAVDWVIFSHHPGEVCKGGVKVSGWMCSFIHLCVVRLLIEVWSIWSMGGSIWPMYCPLLNVTCLLV